ncbi:hypothetical protein Pint_26701 [Pistacia integerrima]|uniref:Uncharacterized protein n=1 Tax=Pistacia integerrima TaxID=434235 RepID=A0ACC0YTJ9_9ROSI|nr:hypothetical protein Pint_26701 [Pistacia integerrima]
MESHNHGPVTVTVNNNGSLRCAAEALVALLVSTLLKTRVLTAQDLFGALMCTKPRIKGDVEAQGSAFDADDANDGDGDDDEDGDGGFDEGEGEEELSSEDGYGNNPPNNNNNNSNSRRRPLGMRPAVELRRMERMTMMKRMGSAKTQMKMMMTTTTMMTMTTTTTGMMKRRKLKTWRMKRMRKMKMRKHFSPQRRGRSKV